jgi:integrase
VAHPGQTGFRPGDRPADWAVGPEAAAALTAFLRAFGLDPFGASARVTVEEWAATWLPIQERERRPKTYAGYRSAVTTWIVPTIGQRPLAALGPADLRAIADALRSAGRAATTARYIQTVLIKMLRDAIVEGHAVPTRALAAKRSATATNDRTSIPLEQATAILRVAAGDPDGSQWAAAFLQGLRQGERLGLTWDCVDLEAGTMEISWQLQSLTHAVGRSGPLRLPDDYVHRQLYGSLSLVRPKTGHGRRVIPLVPWMTESLRVWRAVAPPSPHGLVWPRPDGQPMSTHADRARWRALQDRSGARHPSGRYWVGHEIRHTTATLLMNLGVDETIRMAILGHASIETTRRYQHTDLEHARAALAGAAAVLGLA